METNLRLILTATTTISSLILLYIIFSNMRNIKESLNKIIEHIKRMLIAAKKKDQVEAETHEALRKIDEKVQDTIRSIDDSFEKRYEDFNKKIDDYSKGKPTTIEEKPIAEVKKLDEILDEEIKKPELIITKKEETPPILLLAGPIVVFVGLLYFLLTKNKK